MKNNKSGDRSTCKTDWMSNNIIQQIWQRNTDPKEGGSKESGLKELIPEIQWGIFITNIVSTACKVVKKTQNETVQETCSICTLQEWKTDQMDNIIINAITEKYWQSQKKFFFANAEKCFDKLWLKDSINRNGRDRVQ